MIPMLFFELIERDTRRRIFFIARTLGDVKDITHGIRRYSGRILEDGVREVSLDEMRQLSPAFKRVNVLDEGIRWMSDIRTNTFYLGYIEGPRKA